MRITLLVTSLFSLLIGLLALLGGLTGQGGDAIVGGLLFGGQATLSLVYLSQTKGV